MKSLRNGQHKAYHTMDIYEKLSETNTEPM